MKCRNTLLLLAVVLCTMVLVPMSGGCTHKELSSEHRAALDDTGPYPDNYELTAKAYLSSLASDPRKATYFVNPPEKSYTKQDVGMFYKSERESCYAVKCAITEFSPFSGTVTKSYTLYIKDGQVISADKPFTPQ